MRITVTDFETIDGNLVVKFYSDVGGGVATWVCARQPVKNHEYDVEIDIEKPIDQVKIGNNEDECRHLSEGRHLMVFQNKSTLMYGMIESVEDDGMTYFRLAPDCLIMIELGDSNVKEGDWISLKLQPEDIEISAQGN